MYTTVALGCGIIHCFFSTLIEFLRNKYQNTIIYCNKTYQQEIILL
jgi:hypothetical protein